MKIINVKNGENYSKNLPKTSMSCLDHCPIQKYQIAKYWVNILRIGLFRNTKYLWSPDKSSKLFDSKLIFFIIQGVWEFKSWLFPSFKSFSCWSRMVLGFSSLERFHNHWHRSRSSRCYPFVSQSRSKQYQSS